MLVAYYTEPANPRCVAIGKGLTDGAAVFGDRVVTVKGPNYLPEADVHVAYSRTFDPCFNAATVDGKPWLYWDLPYWGRARMRIPEASFYRVAMNGYHPTRYYRFGLPDDRMQVFRLRPAPWARGRGPNAPVVLCGLSIKAMTALGMEVQSWEQEIIARIRAVSNRPIIYRPKPAWRDAPPISGTVFSPHTESLTHVLANAWAVVVRHSNCAVDATLMGVPAFAQMGPMAPYSQPLEELERPRELDHATRVGIMSDLAYCQWCPKDLMRGRFWRHFRERMLPWHKHATSPYHESPVW